MNAARSGARRGEEWRSALTLGTGVLLAVALLGAVRAVTAERAAEARAERLTETLATVAAGLSFDNVPARDRVSVRDVALGSDEPLPVYRLRSAGRAVGAVLSVVAPHGYGGAIELLVGVRADASVTGVRVLAHRETPGIGDRIERRRSDWMTAFEGRTLEPTGPGDGGTRAERHDGTRLERHDGTHRWRRWQVTHAGGARRDDGTFDALTGATITSRAVVDAVHRALVWFEAHRDTVLAP